MLKLTLFTAVTCFVTHASFAAHTIDEAVVCEDILDGKVYAQTDGKRCALGIRGHEYDVPLNSLNDDMKTWTKDAVQDHYKPVVEPK